MCRKRGYFLMLFVFCFVSFCNISFSQTYNFIEPVNLENPSQSGGVTSININSSSFGDYINNLYVFVIVIICLISVFMLMRGGITYLTSNITNDVKRGKEIIIGVISGLVFIFCIYLIFYLVSPRLLTSNFILGVLDSVAQDAGVPSVENTTGGAPPSSGEKSTGKGVIAGGVKNYTISQGCNKYSDIFQEVAIGSGVSKDLLMAIGNIESGGCNTKAASGHALGMMQIKPETAKGFGCGDIKDPKQSILCATKILKAYKANLGKRSGGIGYKQVGKNRCIKDNDNKLEYCYDEGNGALIASYNAGTGDTGNDPFNTSKDCSNSNSYRWECPKNPQGFLETQNYVWKVQAAQRGDKSVSQK